MATEAEILINEARCLGCSSGASESEMIMIALLQRISGGSQFSESAGVPVAAPANPDAPAQYFDTTNDFTYNWNIGTQAWVPVPKVYRALLTQSGVNAPTASVLENTLGGAIVWARVGLGQYEGTLTGAFPASKTFILIRQFRTEDIANEFSLADATRSTNNVILINTAFVDVSGGWGVGDSANSDSVMVDHSLEILVYP